MLNAGVVMAAPGLAADVRHALALRFQSTDASASGAAAIAVVNLKVLAPALLGAVVVTHEPRMRVVFDAILVGVATINAALIGAALGAYIPRILPWLLHLPLELTALAAALGTYAGARGKRASGEPVKTCTVAVTFVLLAAITEEYTSPH
jgi:hypothetical protein